VRLAALFLAEGKTDLAEKTARDALATAEELDIGPVQAAANLVLGKTLWALGDPKGGERSLEAALLISRKAGDRYGEAKALVAFGTLHGGNNHDGQKVSKKRRALQYLERGALILEQLGAAWDLAAARMELDAQHQSRPVSASAALT
jgi:hypothetical protein